MRINNNISALNTYRQLTTNMAQGSKSLEKLSSGLRINRAGDDAAGLAISEKMRAQIRGLNQAQRNAQDGISMIQTTEGALNEAHSILQRMRELAAQAANDTNVAIDREEIQKEIIQLTSEINRIGNTTEFNTQSLLKGKNVAVVETAAQLDTVVAGEQGVAVGELSALQVNTSSVVGETSSTVVQASSSKATGSVSGVTESTTSVKGAKAFVTVSNGITFEAANLGTDLNGKTITIKGGEGNDVISELTIDGDGNYIFTVGTNGSGDSLATNRGTLYNQLKAAIDNYALSPGFNPASAKISIQVPTDTAEVVTSVDTVGTLTGGVNETTGSYSFSIKDSFEEAGDSVTISGQKFTAVLSGAVASNGEFNVNLQSKVTTTAIDDTKNLTAIGGADHEISITIGGTAYTVDNATVKGYAGTGSGDMVTMLKNAVDADGNKLSDIATVSVANGKISIQTNGVSTERITMSVSGTSAADVAEAFGIRATAAEITSTANLATDLQQTAAILTGTVVVTGSDDWLTQGANTLMINGTEVDLAFVRGLGDGYDTDGNIATFTGELQKDIDAALGAGVITVDDDGAKHIRLTSAAVGNDAEIDLDGSTASLLTELGITTSSAQGGGRSDSALLSITVDGTEYTVDGTNALFDAIDGAPTGDADVKALLDGAKSADGVALSTVATVAVTAGAVSITSDTTGTDSSLSISVTGTADDITSIQTVLGITSGVSSEGTDFVYESQNEEDQATSLAAAIEANSALGARFTVEVDGKNIVLTEKANQATGVALNDPIVAGSGQNDQLVITNSAGQNLNTVTIQAASKVYSEDAKFSIGADGKTATITAAGAGSRANQVTVKVVQNSSNELNVSYKNGTLTISLADTAATKNNVGNISTAIKALGTKDGINFSGWTVADDATWDGNTTGATVEDPGTLTTNGIDAVELNEMTVTADGADLTIHLSGDKASENMAAKIQEAVQALGELSYVNSHGEWDTIDYSKFTFEAQGQWDTNTLGNSIIVGEGTFVGGTEEVLGEFEFEIDTAFAAGDKVELNGKVFTAVASGAVASKGQFNVAGGNINAQAAGLIDAINLSSLKDTYTASANAGIITISEKVATGDDLATNDLKVRATGTQGEYTIAQSELMENGAKFIVDGEEILITNANAHVGYSNGTAVKVTDTVAAQTQALADAVNANANLNTKYTASVASDGSLKLTQTEDYTVSTAPEASTKNSSIGDFSATFQIGSNSGQSMTITVGDMRANSLNISGNGSVGTVAANNGAIATYATVANVNSGSDNNSVEFALDVTTSEKASAALSVINDAIERVSSQRSQLGAFQNRLEHTINNLGTSAENLVAAESRIRDVDMAAEMMAFTKNNILSQAAQAMLAQANQLPQGVLQLLR